VIWTILTGEYPPACGGLGDYTAQLAAALTAAGDRVTVATPGAPSDLRPADGVRLLPLPDHFGPAARVVLDAHVAAMQRPHCMLVQYVPNAFGLKGANVGFCSWLLRRARDHGDDVRVMFHEPYFYFGWDRPYRNVLAVVQRGMAAILQRASRQVYYSTDAWDAYLRPLRPAGTPRLTLPIPASIPCCGSAGHARAYRLELGVPAGVGLVGHFGTYGPHIAVPLAQALTALLAGARTSALCIGAGSEKFAAGLRASHPELEGRVHATGRVDAAEAAVRIAACDLMLQPYPDGVTTRRTSVMAALVNGRPVVTTSGALTENVWEGTGAVALAPADDMDALADAARSLLMDPHALSDLAARGLRAYLAQFSLDHTVKQLRLRAEGAAA
jgi:glycosyltransferase involved in cell wall biosynthesis